MNIYLAAPMGEDLREHMWKAAKILRDRGFVVYVPAEHPLENSWDWPNEEWGMQTFRCDIEAIKRSDFVVVLNFGRLETSAGTTLEQGYAYGIGKKVILVEMTDNIQSLMCANARFATIKGLKDLKTYDFDNPKPLRVNTEQK